MLDFSSFPQDKKAKIQYTIELRRRRRAKLSFNEWLKHTSPQYQWDLPHLVYMQAYLERIINGESLNLMFLAPPRHGKSEQNTIHFGAYFVDRFPNLQTLIGAYNNKFAARFSRHIKHIVKKYHPLSKETFSNYDWETTKEGGVFAAGLKTGVTGRGFNLLILDDLIKDQREAESKTYREDAWEWYQHDLLTRVEPGASKIFTMTPRHVDDLAGRIIAEEGDEWVVIRLPALAEEDDPLGRKVDEALWEERFSAEWLKKIRKKCPGLFYSLYQGQPTIAEGAIYKRSYWRYYIEKPNFDMIVSSYDTATTEKKQNDLTACTVWGITKAAYYLLAWWEKHLDALGILREIQITNNIWHENKILIENKSSGQTVIPIIKKTTRLPVQGIEPRGDKVARANTAIPTIGSINPKTQEIGQGCVFLPDPSIAQWVKKFVDTMAKFPNDVHDDTPDTVSQIINFGNEGHLGTPSVRSLV